MNESTIEQTLAKLASVDSAGGVELALDRSIYLPHVVDRAVTALRQNPVASITSITADSIRITAADPQAARLAVGLALTLLVQFAAASSSEP
jgi:hypothetical protein